MSALPYMIRGVDYKYLVCILKVCSFTKTMPEVFGHVTDNSKSIVKFFICKEFIWRCLTRWRVLPEWTCPEKNGWKLG